MKRVLLLVSMGLLIISGVNAQYFAGGSISFSHTGGSVDDGTTTTDKQSINAFSFEPQVGYVLSEDLWVGVGLGFGLDRTKTPGATESILKNNYFGIMPFARYHVVRMNKWALGAVGRIGVGFYTQKTEAGGTTTDGPKTTAFVFDVAPGVFYDLNDKVVLEARIGGLSLGYYFNSVKNETGGVTTKNNSNGFNFGADLDDIFTTGAISVGASIKF